MKTSGSTLSDKRFNEILTGQLRAGKRAALCSILDTRGSMPRPADARMALLESGEFVGTIGGGRIELLVQERCRELLAAALGGGGETEGFSELRWIRNAETGMMCGGDAFVAIRMLGKADCAVLEDVLACDLDDGVLVEDWSHPADPLWHVERGAGARAIPSMPAWDDATSVYEEPLRGRARVYLYGAGHVAQALAPVLDSIGFGVSVFDERPEFATAERFPDAELLRLCRFEALAADELPSARDYAIIMTPSHSNDYAVLEQAIRCQPTYLGCIGSKGKTARFKKWLAEAGISQEAIDAVHMPIGDPIDAVTPAEIAISIAAELVRFRASKR